MNQVIHRYEFFSLLSSSKTHKKVFQLKVIGARSLILFQIFPENFFFSSRLLQDREKYCEKQQKTVQN